MMNYKKYERYEPFILKDRTWPTKKITNAPIWCSVDLRDGNQALKNPMDVDKKLKLFRHLVAIGIKQIEVGFPFASETEYEFVRTLIENNYIPNDVTISVLSSSSKECIDCSFGALRGADKAAIQIYTLCSPAQRKYVINMSKNELINYTAEAATYTLQKTKEYKDTKFTLGYGPESFTITEMDFSLAICNSVVNAWKPTENSKCMITLPATVEASMANQFADQVEYINNNLVMRENVIIGLHTHNDRGTSIASTELGLLAGAERVEGTLFGNGERTGNLDLVTLALNMYSSGIDPKLDFSNLDETVNIYESCTGCKVHDRHPYAGKQVFTAYSGGHQDAIRKGLIYREENMEEKWMVPYIPVDPTDLGRSMDGIIQINSQSGKGGVCYILEKELGIKVPRAIQKDFGKKIKVLSNEASSCLSNVEIVTKFLEEYDLTTEEYNISNIHRDNKVNITFKYNSQLYEISESEENVLKKVFDMLKEELLLSDAVLEEHVDMQDQNGHFYSFIKLYRNSRNSEGLAFGIGNEKIKTQLLVLLKAIEQL